MNENENIINKLLDITKPRVLIFLGSGHHGQFGMPLMDDFFNKINIKCSSTDTINYPITTFQDLIKLISVVNYSDKYKEILEQCKNEIIRENPQKQNLIIDSHIKNQLRLNLENILTFILNFINRIKKLDKNKRDILNLYAYLQNFKVNDKILDEINVHDKNILDRLQKTNIRTLIDRNITYKNIPDEFILDILEKVLEFLKEKMRVSYSLPGDHYNRMEEIRKIMTYYKEFLNLTEENNRNIIFTTNYDLIIDEIIRQRAQKEYFDFFYFDRQRNRKLFSPIESFKNLEANNNQLYKIHGSMSWYKENDIIFDKQTEHNKIDEISFLLPVIGSIKNTSGDSNFKFLYELLNEFLLYDTTQIVVSVGYSFRDTEIREIFENSLKYNKKLKLIIVGKSIFDENFEDKNVVKFISNGVKEERIFKIRYYFGGDEHHNMIIGIKNILENFINI
jgi:hypothetical protein